MTTRVALVAGLVLCVCAAATMGQPSTREASGGAELGAVRATQQVQASRPAAFAVLRKRVDVDWDEKTFEEVMIWLREQGPINVIARMDPLGVEGVDYETTVTLRLRNVPVATVLNETLDLLSDTGKLRYRAEGETLKISTEDDFSRKLYVRVYPVTDLMMRQINFARSAPNIDLQNVQSNQGGSGGGGQQSIFSGSTGGQDEFQQQGNQQNEQNDALDELSLLIQETIAPETWLEAGGRGVIRYYRKALVIRNTIEVHEAIAGAFSFDD